MVEKDKKNVEGEDFLARLTFAQVFFHRNVNKILIFRSDFLRNAKNVLSKRVGSVVQSQGYFLIETNDNFCSQCPTTRLIRPYLALLS